MKELQAVIYFSIYIKTGRSGSTQNYNNKVFFFFFFLPPDILKGCKQWLSFWSIIPYIVIPTDSGWLPSYVNILSSIFGK